LTALYRVFPLQFQSINLRNPWISTVPEKVWFRKGNCTVAREKEGAYGGLYRNEGAGSGTLARQHRAE
jgi:hypothetical protein